MSLAADARDLVVRRYPLLCVLTLVGVTAIVQAPRLAQFGALSQEALKYRSQTLAADDQRPTMPEIAKWGRAVPSANLIESSQFLVALEQLALETKCDIGNTGDAEAKPVEGADNLDAIEANIEVQGTYDGLVRFLTLIREDERVLAITRANISANEYPRLHANLTLRRYVRHTGAALKSRSASASNQSGS